MALTYQEIYKLMHEVGALWEKSEVACFKAAVDVLNEDTGTTNHANRVLWAQAVLLSNAKSNEMKYHILQNATIQALGNASTDNDVQFVVNSLIDTFATGV